MDNKQIVHNYFLWLILYVLNILSLKKLFYSVVIFPDRLFMKKVYCWTKFYILKMQIALIAVEFVNKCDIMTSQNFQSGGGGGLWNLTWRLLGANIMSATVSLFFWNGYNKNTDGKITRTNVTQIPSTYNIALT